MTLSKLLFSLLFLMALNTLNAQGWERIFGTPRKDIPTSLTASPDGGYLLGGYTLEPTGIKHDILLYKTDVDGQLQWSKTIGKSGFSEQAYGLTTNPDGTYLMLGIRYHDSENIDGRAWIVKLNAVGDTLWSRSFFANLCADVAFDAKPLRNGSGYIITGKVCTDRKSVV